VAFDWPLPLGQIDNAVTAFAQDAEQFIGAYLTTWSPAPLAKLAVGTPLSSPGRLLLFSSASPMNILLSGYAISKTTIKFPG